MFRASACRGRRSLRGTGSLILGGSFRVRRAGSGRNTDRGCRLSYNWLTADLERGFEFEQNGLLEEDLSGFKAKSTNLVFS